MVHERVEYWGRLTSQRQGRYSVIARRVDIGISVARDIGIMLHKPYVSGLPGRYHTASVIQSSATTVTSHTLEMAVLCNGVV